MDAPAREEENGAGAAGVPAGLDPRTLRGADDGRAAVVTIEPAAGGSEAGQWALLLLRMYQGWAASHGLSAELLDIEQGEDAGIEYAELEVSGPYAYGRLKAEHGVHRLVRIPPSQTRRHVSFALVLVEPVLDDGRRGKHASVPENQIRTCVLHPSMLVTDHRTGLQIEDAQAVLDGGIDPFIHAYLEALQAAPDG